MRFLASLLLLLALPASAADYAQPAGAPELFVPGHNVTVSVFAVQTPVGQGIGILERRDGTWFLCGQCLISPEIPSMEAAVRRAGGAERYVESKRDTINAVLAARYPLTTDRRSDVGIDGVNKALTGSSVLKLINGVPQLGPR